MPKPAVGWGRLGGLRELVVVVEDKEPALLRRDLRRGWEGVVSRVGMGLRGEGEAGCGDVWVWACSQSWRRAEARSK